MASYPRDRTGQPTRHHARNFLAFSEKFLKRNSSGIAPRSNYLRVIGDFARWKERIVFGCDDSAQKEFLNHRPFKSAKGALSSQTPICGL